MDKGRPLATGTKRGTEADDQNGRKDHGGCI